MAGVAAPAASWAECTDPASVATARARIERRCPCTESPSHEQYLGCAKKIVRRLVQNGTLGVACRPAVMRCVRRSACGRPGYAATCVQRAGRDPVCRVLPFDEATSDACVSGQWSCCDAPCTAGGCPVDPPTCGDTGIAGAGYPTCGGSCPPGLACQAFTASSELWPPHLVGCFCTRPEARCGNYEACSRESLLEIGTCPPGQVCSVFFGGLECFCTPPPP